MTLESLASFIVLSFLTVNIIGELKLLSLHLSTLITLTFFCNFLNSSSTCDCRWIGILRPLWWMGVKFVLNFDLTVWFFDRPILFIRLGKFLAISIFKFCPSRFCIIATFLPSALGEGCWLTWIPSPWNKSWPLIALWLLVTTIRSALPAFQKLHTMTQYIVPIFLMGVFVKLHKFVGFVLRLHQLFFLVLYLMRHSFCYQTVWTTWVHHYPVIGITKIYVEFFWVWVILQLGKLSWPCSRPRTPFRYSLFHCLMKPFFYLLLVLCFIWFDYFVDITIVSICSGWTCRPWLDDRIHYIFYTSVLWLDTKPDVLVSRADHSLDSYVAGIVCLTDLNWLWAYFGCFWAG